MTRRFLILGLLLGSLLTGCLTMPGSDGRTGTSNGPDIAVERATFEDPQASLLAARVTGCGFCVGRSDYRQPEHQSLAVFENGRATLIRFNFAPNNTHDQVTVHVADAVTFDRGAIQAAVAAPGTWTGGDLYVAEVETYRITRGFDAFESAVREAWVAPSTEGELDCVDCDLPAYLKGEPPGQARINVRDVPADEPFHRVVLAFRALDAALPEVDGGA